MIDHLAFDVADIGRSRAFYAAALAPLGYRIDAACHVPA
jgi:extradiol dioxygenase family protein